MAGRTIHSADQILRLVWESRSILEAPKTQKLGMMKSWGAALFCGSTEDCLGKPTQEPSETGEVILKCSDCRKLWPSRPVEMGSNEIGQCKPRRATAAEPPQYGDLIDLGLWVVRRVFDEYPIPTVAWITHVVGPGQPVTHNQGPGGTEVSVNTLGVPYCDIPAHLYRAERDGMIRELGTVTDYKVRAWIEIARNRSMGVLAERGLSRAS